MRWMISTDGLPEDGVCDVTEAIAGNGVDAVWNNAIHMYPCTLLLCSEDAGVITVHKERPASEAVYCAFCKHFIRGGAMRRDEQPCCLDCY